MKLHKWSDIRRSKSDPERAERVKSRAQAELRAMTLRELREEVGRTQTELAELAEVTQSALSRIERREDNPIEALRRYVEALGGELEVVAVIGNKRVKLLGV
jgi:DNA-binding XRE family transcriptional regulator